MVKKHGKYTSGTRAVKRGGAVNVTLYSSKATVMSWNACLCIKFSKIKDILLAKYDNIGTPIRPKIIHTKKNRQAANLLIAQHVCPKVLKNVPKALLWNKQALRFCHIYLGNLWWSESPMLVWGYHVPRHTQHMVFICVTTGATAHNHNIILIPF